MYVILPITAPVTITSPQENSVVRVPEFSATVFLCNATGLPKPVIYWSVEKRKRREFTMQSGTFLSTGYHYVISSLRLSFISRDDAGTYTCTANNTIQDLDVRMDRTFSLIVICE